MIRECHLLRSSVSRSHSSLSSFKISKSRLQTSLQSWSTDVTFANDQLTEYQSLWDVLVAHSQNMTKPAKPALAEIGVHSGKTSTPKYFFFGNLMLPSNSKNTTEASLMEGVNFLLLHS